MFSIIKMLLPGPSGLGQRNKNISAHSAVWAKCPAGYKRDIKTLIYCSLLLKRFYRIICKCLEKNMVAIFFNLMGQTFSFMNLEVSNISIIHRKSSSLATRYYFLIVRYQTFLEIKKQTFERFKFWKKYFYSYKWVWMDNFHILIFIKQILSQNYSFFNIHISGNHIKTSLVIT